MAGFLKTMKRLLVGEPVFQVGDDQKTADTKSIDDSTGKWQDSILPDDTGAHVENPDAYKPTYIENELPEVSPLATPAPDLVPEADKTHDEHGNKIIPEAEITSCETHLKGENCEVWANIRNNSAFEIELDAVRVLGNKTELDRRLLPGDEHKFKIFTGAMPRDDHSREAELYYKNVKSGDYFCARHIIEYQYESDGTYIIEEMRIVRPIRDV